jgi:branched-chain amino acid transport system permease protein
MRRLPLRLVLAGAILALLVMKSGEGWAAPDFQVDGQAWAQTGTVPVAAPQEGRLYVAATGGSEDARALIHVDVTGLDNAALAEARLVLVEDGADSVMAEGAKLAACVLGGPFSGEGRLEGEPPPADCTLRVEPHRTPEGTWVVELGVFVERWTSGQDYGLALFPGTNEFTSTFRLAFDAAETSLEGVDAPTIPEPEPEGEVVPVPTPEADPAPSSAPATEPVVPPLPEPPPSLAVGTDAIVTPPLPTPSTAPASPETLTGVGRDAASPSVFGFLAGLAALAGLALVILRRRGHHVMLPPRLSGLPGITASIGLAVLGLALLPLRYSELTIFKAGFVLVFVVAVLGLHVLVNWAGQLSLAHAAMVGLPAFIVLAISATHGISPLYLLPLGMLVGALVGAVVALPAMRARGMYVALVTFAAGIGIERFFFAQSWLAGPVGGRRAATPALGPVEFTTSKGLYPVVLAIVGLVLLATWAVMHSRVARAWFWIRSDPDAAAAVGIPVGLYKILAYATAGALAGVGGSLFAIWIPQFTSESFPFTLSFDYLLVAVLAGPGYAGGVVVAALVLQGGRLFFTFFGWIGTLFDYLGPLALIINLTTHQSGFNGLGRILMEKLTERQQAGATAATPADRPAEPISVTLIAGVVTILAGFIAIAVAWYHTGNTDEVWIQNQELVSGGVGGLALVIVGAALLIRDRLASQHAILARQLELLSGRGRAHGGSPDESLVLEEV